MASQSTDLLFDLILDPTLLDLVLAMPDLTWREIATTAATLIVAQDPAPLVHIVNLFYEIAGGTSRCTEHAVSAVREHLPVRMATDNELLQDLGERMVRAWRAKS